ncbi:hypothetical protein AAMO2058_001399800 [Amorphochlora amoebiformis]
MATLSPNEASILSWGLVAAVLVLGIVCHMVYQYSRRGSPILVRLATVWCWWCTFSLIYLLPIDLGPSARVGESLLHIWTFMYWTSFVLAWTVIPIAWYYYDVGDFTSWGKLRAALRGNLRFYAIWGVLLIGFLIFLAVREDMSGQGVLGFAICLSNTWGLTLYVLLLGYGLVEIPRTFWYQSDLNKALEYCYYKAQVTHDLMERAADDLVCTQTLISKLKRTVSNDYLYHHQFSEIEESLGALDHVDLKMDGNLSDFSETDLFKEISDSKEPSLPLLIKTNRHVRISIRKYFRLRDTLQDTAENGAYLESVIARRSRDLPTICGQGLGGVGAALRIRWMLRYRRMAFRAVSLILACMSILLIWSQLTIKARFLSPWALTYEFSRNSDFKTQIAMLIPLTYLCTCAFYSMFRLRLFDYYFMHSKRRTEEVSLLFNGTYLLRIFAPIGFNFVVLVGARDTAFQKVMGAMDVVPFFGSAFNTYLPILISIFCLCTLFNVYNRLLRFLGIQQFSYGGRNDPDKLLEGKKIVASFSSSIRDEMADTFL